MASATGQPHWTHKTPSSAEDRPLTDPTDRSISPTMRTQTIPSEMMPTVEQSKSRLTRLFGCRNTGFSVWKIVQISTSPTTTGSEPRSPDRTRSRKPSMAPFAPLRSFSRSSVRSSSARGLRSEAVVMAVLPAPSPRPCACCAARPRCRRRRLSRSPVPGWMRPAGRSRCCGQASTPRSGRPRRARPPCCG